MLETAWLLSSQYRLSRADLAATLRDVMRLPELRVSNEASVLWAIDRFTAGADFADMIHIMTARHTEAFVSFDKKLARLAGPDSPLAIELPA